MEKLKDDIQVDIRSEEVQEIMGQVPSWILRWGIVAMAGILALFFVISCFFRMPQSLTARVRLTTATPPVEIHAYSEGQLERINVSDKQSVVSGQILASVKNMADARDIMLIDSVYSLWKAGRMTTDSLLITVHDRSWQTGELQSSFFELVQSIEHYKNYIKRNYYPRKIALNKEEQSKRNRMEKDQFEEMSLNEELLTLSHKMFKRDSILFSRNVGSGDVYDKSYMVYLQNRRILIENKQMRQESELRRIEDRNAALDLKNQYEEKLSDFDRTVQNACNQWEVQVKAWKKTYLLRSSVDGVVNFMGIRSANQYVTTGELVFIILPHNPDTPIGRASLSASGAGKVEVGQKVSVRLDNYPDKEYGFLTGYVSSISEIPDNDGNYFLEIRFPKGLKTNYHKNLPLSKQMVGTAQIIIGDKRLIEKFVEPISKIIRENT